MLPKWLAIAFLIGSLCAACANWEAVYTESGQKSYQPPWVKPVVHRWKTNPETMHNRNLTRAEHDAMIAKYCAEHQEDWCFKKYEPFVAKHKIQPDSMIADGSGAGSG
jgi:hypothetical protein